MRPFPLALAAAFAVVGLLAAEDCSAQDNAGNTFEEALILPPGTLSVSEELLYLDGFLPDLYLGVRDEFGSFYAEDDDSSFFGDGFAPGIDSLPINPGGEIDFAISGFEEIPFAGDHFEFGQFEVSIDIYTNDGGFTFIDSLLLEGFIEEGQIIDFFESDPTWDGAIFDINVNNAFPNDVDFFRFTGLTPGEEFTAETLQVEEAFIDTVLGLFDESGQLIDSADEGGEFNYSKLTGVVPANGELVLAVSGFPDIYSFDGFHPFFGPYELSLTIGGGNVVGDYDGDLDVDADDYTVWANAYGDTGTGLAADGNGDGVVDAADYTLWRDALGAAQAAAVPEPAGLVLVLFAMTAVPAGRKRSR